MIKLENLTKIYPDGTRAVDNVNLEIEKGELCVFLGPSGCGKTTLMKMINRLIPITEGRICLEGVDITTIDETELRRNMGYAIQEIGLFPHMTVGQNIEIVPALKGWLKKDRGRRIEKLLALVRMKPEEFTDKYPNELSGGERQRVGVARALGADPPILLMDEPFGAIDPITRIELQNEFLNIQEKIKKTIVFVTHDIYEAIKLGDKIALMKQGRLVQYDTPTKLLYQPKDDFVESFVGADRAIKGLQLLRVKDVMDTSFTSAKAGDSIQLMKERLRKSGSDRLIVVDVDGNLMGWTFMSDLEDGRQIGEIVRPAIVTCTSDDVVSVALSKMLSSGLKELPVVKKDTNRAEGILTFAAIQNALSETVKNEAHK